jgi:hypothetical protein
MISGTARLGQHATALVPSALADRLRAATPDDDAARPDALRAFRTARHRFISGERIDMGRLATELGVDRTSLFRWVGNRDQLLSEVLWSLAVPTLDAADQAVTATGAQRIVGVLSHFVDDLIAAPYFRVFLNREPSRALRLLTTTDSDVQRRYVAVMTLLVDEEHAAGRFDPAPLSARELASLLVRISESFTYADLITGEPPDADRARVAFEYVLRTGS